MLNIHEKYLKEKDEKFKKNTLNTKTLGYELK